MNRLIQFIVENHHFSVLLMLIILVFGVASIENTKLTSDPEFDSPKVIMVFTLVGASPSEMQRNVVSPIEAEIRSIANITTVRTLMYHNRAESLIRFELGVDVPEKIREIEARINSIKRKLPSKLDYHSIRLRSSEFLSAFLFSLNSDVESLEKQYQVAQDFVSFLEKIDGLKNIDVVAVDENVEVILDLPKMNHLGVSIDDVSAAIGADNAFGASGRVHINDQYFRFSGSESRYQQFQDIANTLVYSSEENPIPLREIAEIRKNPIGDAGITRHNGKPTFFVKAGASGEGNILEISNRVDAAVEKFRQAQPSSMRIDRVFSQSEGVRTLVFDLVKNFLQGIMILGLVLLFSVGFRSTLIISSILPLSVVIAIILFNYTGYGIQQVAIAGFIIALGLIVDNAIVVTEYAYLLQKYQGYSRMDAAINGTASAVVPLLSSTMTTMLAFTPIFLLTSDIGLFLRSLSVSIWLSLAASLFTAVTIITLLLSRFGTLGGIWKIPNPPSFLIMLIPFRDRIYQAILRLAVRFRIVTLLLFVVALFVALFSSTGLKVEMFPPTGEPYFTINLEMPSGTDKKTRIWLASEIEKTVLANEQVEFVSVFSGMEPPKPNIVMNFLGDMVCLVRTTTSDISKQQQLIKTLKQALHPLKAYGDITFSLYQYQDLTYTAPVTIQILGNDLQTLKTFSYVINNQMHDAEGVESMNNPLQSNQTALHLEFDAERAAALGVAKSDVDQLTNMLVYGFEIERFRDSRGEEFPLLIKFQAADRAPLEILEEIQVPLRRGGTVPLSQVVEAKFMESENRISHLQYQPAVEIDFFPKDGYTPDEVANNVMEVIKKNKIPDGITVKIGGALEGKEQNFKGLGNNALMVVALIFAIFVLQFKSFAQSFIIFTVIPMCIIGVIVGLLVADQSMSFYAAIGVTSLMGIVVNDSILLVEEGNHLLKQQPEIGVIEAAIQAGVKRFMPVLLTSVTTIACLFPLALSKSVFKGMAIAIIGGLMSSTLLLLFLVPVLYSFLSNRRASS